MEDSPRLANILVRASDTLVRSQTSQLADARAGVEMHGTVCGRFERGELRSAEPDRVRCADDMRGPAAYVFFGPLNQPASSLI